MEGKMKVVNQFLEVEGCNFLESRECRKCSVSVLCSKLFLLS